MTPKEALARIKTVIKDFGVYRQYTNSDTPFYEDIENVEHALTELEALKCDVARYFELDSNEALFDDDCTEWEVLRNKLSKVGNNK